MLDKLNTIWSALIVSSMFVGLVYAAQLKETENAEIGYNQSVFEVLPKPAVTGINPLLPKVIQVESGGNPNAVSKKGAKGIAQIMPATAKHPGFGIQPLRNKSIKEQLRFANDYLNTMETRYGSKRLALAAYNCGPKCVEAGNLPQETKDYINKVMATE